MGSTRLSRFLDSLYKRGLSKKTIDDLLSGKPLTSELEAFIVVDEARRHGANVLFEDEVGGLGSEPVYATILELDHVLVVYLASSMVHEVRLMDRSSYWRALRVAREFIESMGRVG